MIRTVMANRRLMLSVREKRCYYKFLNDEKIARAKSRSLEEKLVEMNDLCEQAQLHFQWFRGQSRYINVKDVTSVILAKLPIAWFAVSGNLVLTVWLVDP